MWFIQNLVFNLVMLQVLWMNNLQIFDWLCDLLFLKWFVRIIFVISKLVEVWLWFHILSFKCYVLFLDSKLVHTIWFLMRFIFFFNTGYVNCNDLLSACWLWSRREEKSDCFLRWSSVNMQVTYLVIDCSYS